MDTAATPRADLAALNEIARIATLDLELAPMLQRITDALARIFDWEFVACVLVDREKERFVCKAVTSSLPSVIKVGYSRPLGSGVVGRVALTAQPIAIDDVRTDPEYVETLPGVLSELCVPVTHHGRLIAVLNAESTRLGAFAGQLPLLQTIADQIAGAISSAELYEKLQKRAEQFAMLSEVSRLALQAGELREILEMLTAYIRDEFEFVVVEVLLADERGEQFDVVSSVHADVTAVLPRKWPMKGGIAGRAFETGRPQLVTDVRSDPDYIEYSDAVVAEYVVPLRFREMTLGVFNVEAASAGVFDLDTRIMLDTLVDQVAGVIHLATLNDRLANTNKVVEEQRRALELANQRLQLANQELERLSITDSLTGVANRRRFEEVFSEEWRRAVRSQQPLSVIMLDLDCFKAYNDNYGHRMGDDCLVAVARALASSLQRAGDLVARYGGEEFVVVLPGCPLETAQMMAENLRQRVAALGIEHRYSSAARSVTASFGVAADVPTVKESSDTLLHRADEALYEAKRRGRNQVSVGTQ